MHSHWILIMVSMLTLCVEAMVPDASQSKTVFKRTASGNFIGHIILRPASPGDVENGFDQYENPLPPAIFRNSPQSPFSSYSSSESSSSYSPSNSLSSSFSSSHGLVWPDLNKEYNSGEEVIVEQHSSYYLVLYNDLTRTVEVLDADSESELLKKYLFHYINQSGTEVADHIRRFLKQKSEQFSLDSKGSWMEIACRAEKNSCNQRFINNSPESLMQQLFIHHTIDHAQLIDWKKRIVTLMGRSFFEAQSKHSTSTLNPLAPQNVEMQNALVYSQIIFENCPSSPASCLSVLPSLPSLNNLQLMDEELKLPEFGSWAEDLWNADQRTEYFIVVYDTNYKNHLILKASSKNKVIAQLLVHLIKQGDKDACSSIDQVQNHHVHDLVISQYLDQFKGQCNVDQCGYAPLHSSCEQLKLEMLVHIIMHHQKHSYIYTYINACIKNSLEDALSAIKEI